MAMRAGRLWICALLVVPALVSAQSNATGGSRGPAGAGTMSAQSNVIANMAQERDDLLRRTVNDWLDGRAVSSRDLVQFVELDVYLLKYKYPSWIDGIDPSRSLPPQLFMRYLQTRHGISLSPVDLLRGHKVQIRTAGR